MIRFTYLFLEQLSECSAVFCIIARPPAGGSVFIFIIHLSIAAKI